MLNYLWGSMILIGIIFSVFSGNLSCITNAAINSSKEAVTICLTMLGVLTMWTGLMKIAEKSGLIDALSEKMMPLLKFLFPHLPKQSKAMQYISTNIIANMLGLSWAATPAGLKAMDELQKINPDKETASREMCMFMIINMSSLQIVSVNIIAYRSQYNSQNPSEIIGPGLLATLVSTIVAIVITKILERYDK
jgi:Uncharacterized membrane protein, required for spore maturation in B.subtilis.